MENNRFRAANYYISTKEHPYHLSVGAIVLNKRGEVLCHRYESKQVNGDTVKNLHLLVRETLEPGEVLEDALHRGLWEEAGARVKIVTFIGSIVSKFPRQDVFVQKTTLYYLCRLESIEINKRDTDDAEADSEIIFLPIDELINRMKQQSIGLERTDLDESRVLEKARIYTLSR
ncbi:MAG: NUDIX hydrolase [Patescibacteria group bacterium]